MFPLAPRFDTVGWFARTGALAREVGRVLLPPTTGPQDVGRLLVAVDLFGQCDAGHTDAIDDAVGQVAKATGLPAERVQLWGEAGDVGRWGEAFRAMQRFDAWQANRGWIEALDPTFGPRVAPRWDEAAAVTEDENREAEQLGLELSERAWELLSGGTVLIVPSAPGPAPLLDSDRASLAATRLRLMTVTVISPILGAPEVSLPLMQFDGLPVGLGLIAAPGCDEMLLDLTAALV